MWDTRFTTNDPFWVKKAGLQALSLAGQLGVANPDKFIDDLEKVLPQLRDSLEKKNGRPCWRKRNDATGLTPGRHESSF